MKKFTGYGTRIVFEDSQKRLWLGFNGSGLGMVNEETGEIKYWFNDNKRRNTIIGNSVVDIKEDKDGVIWVSSFNGVTGLDLKKDTAYWLDDKNVFKSNFSGPLAVDAYNRLWIGTGNGLYMLDKDRKTMLYFDETDGLAGVSFSEHSGCILSSGEIMMPTTHGYVRFHPDNFSNKGEINRYYIASVESGTAKWYLPPENPLEVNLGEKQNYFTVGLEAINFENPGQVSYACKLEGYDKDWRKTQDPRAVYTNVPGGHYTFRFRASAGNGMLQAEEKVLKIFVAAPFYSQSWFWILIGLLLVALAVWFYKHRIRQAQQVHRLETKAQSLEKEKAQVMYESLKQQLNPHFLFNSLTSLSGLIEMDQALAGSFLKQMSRIYRYILKNSDNELVPLKDELDFVQVYINLQKTRFKKGLEVNIRMNEEYARRQIAPVTLQNLVENALKHNIIDDEFPLTIDIYTSDNYIVVQNNLQKKHVVESSNKQGLANLQSLYRFLADRPMKIEEDAQYFRTSIPLI